MDSNIPEFSKTELEVKLGNFDMEQDFQAEIISQINFYLKF